MYLQGNEQDAEDYIKIPTSHIQYGPNRSHAVLPFYVHNTPVLN